MSEGRKCPRCGRGFGYGNCTHHPPCDRKIGGRHPGKMPDFSRTEKLVADAYARYARKKRREARVPTPGIIEPEFLT